MVVLMQGKNSEEKCGRNLLPEEIANLVGFCQRPLCPTSQQKKVGMRFIFIRFKRDEIHSSFLLVKICQFSISRWKFIHENRQILGLYDAVQDVSRSSIISQSRNRNWWLREEIRAVSLTVSFQLSVWKTLTKLDENLLMLLMSLPRR